jgi:hypothetical protein
MRFLQSDPELKTVPAASLLAPAAAARDERMRAGI